MHSPVAVDPPVAATRAPGRRRLIRAFWLAFALAVLWSAAALYVPPLVRHLAEGLGAEQLGRPVSVGMVAFRPWSLALTIDGLAIGAAAPPGATAGTAATPPQLRVRRIEADLAVESLARWAPVVDALRIEAPALRLTRDAAGRLDIDDVVERLTARPSAEPARFAIHNIVVTEGSADVLDTGVEATHRLRDLELGIPFVSSLPSQREIQVEPRLAFVLDGSRFDSSAAATPFGETGQGEARVKLVGVDVVPWLAYLPKGLPVQLRAAVLGADLRLAFEQRPRLSLRISGTIDVAGLKVVDAASQQVLDAGSVRVAISELRPLERVLHLGRVDVQAPHLLAARDAQGRVNLLVVADAAAAPAAAVRLPLPTSAASAGTGAPSASAATGATTAKGASAAKTVRGGSAGSATPWRVVVDAMSVRAGRLAWRDATTAPAAALALADVSIDATAARWPLDAPVRFEAKGTLEGTDGRGRLRASGQGNGAGASLRLAAEALPLGLAAPYVRGVVVPPLTGSLGADLAVEWRPADGRNELKVEAIRIAVDALRLGDPKAPELALDRLEIGPASVDTAARTVRLGRVAVHAPRLRVERDSAGRWTVDRWRVVAGPSAVSTSAPAAPTAPTAPTAPARAVEARPDRAWTLAIDEIEVGNGRLGFADRAQVAPVELDISELALTLGGFALDAKRPAPFRFAARVAVPAGPAGATAGSGIVGSVEARGELSAFAAGVPASARATLLLKDLPLHLLDPYLDDVLNIDVQKAQTSFRGDVAYDGGPSGMRLRVQGDATVDDFRATGAGSEPAAPRRALGRVRDGSATGRPLLNWKSLGLRGLDVAVAPGAATRVGVAEASLADFFARIVLDESGRLNLQDLTRPLPAGAGSIPASAASSVDKPPAIVRLGPIVVTGGRVNFNDRFVRPNYTANLSELSGRLGAFSSQGTAPGQPPALADIELRGRVEGTASLEVTGKLNPLATPLALDIAAKVRDLELPPLSPYTTKYAGHGVERGKMSVDLAYVVQPDGRLSASNRIVLNQLVFGDPVEGAPTSLPVKLAVALLADRNGVIDIDLPVSGSINDPQFSIAGVIGKALGQLVVRAVTAPFSLLASAFASGGSETSAIEFAPGTATLAPAARASLDRIAVALAERPQLIMTVTGESRLEVERDAWKRERLQQIVRAEKRRAGLGAAAAAVPAAEVAVDEAEYPGLLREVYRRADIVKPKNVLGVARELSVGEMEALLLAGLTVGEEAMQQLAVRRGVVVRDYLASKQLPTRRLFLGAPKTAGGGEPWTPRADLTLAAG
jgi:uncharacterized protein involved in outer membrane biogenesis